MISLGTLLALKRNIYVDNTIQISVLPVISVPEFWFTIIAVLVFSLDLGSSPTSGHTSPLDDMWESLTYFILPAITIGFQQAAYTTQLTRSSMLDEMNIEYVETRVPLVFLSERLFISAPSETL